MKRILLFSFLFTFPVSFLVAEEKYVKSKNSNKYHLTSRQWAKRINPDNLVSFDSPEAAASASYIPCKVCKPPSAKEATTAQPQVKKQASSSSQVSTQCAAITKKGTRCKRKVSPGSQYCWQHGR